MVAAAIVKQVLGDVIAFDKAGNITEPKVGDILNLNQTIKTNDADSSITLVLANNKEIKLLGNDRLVLDQSASINESFENETMTNIETLQKALLNGVDVTNLEETAAGGAAGADGVSLGSVSFLDGGHVSNVLADYGNLDNRIQNERFVTPSSGSITPNSQTSRVVGEVDFTFLEDKSGDGVINRNENDPKNGGDGEEGKTTVRVEIPNTARPGDIVVIQTPQGKVTKEIPSDPNNPSLPPKTIDVPNVPINSNGKTNVTVRIDTPNNPGEPNTKTIETDTITPADNHKNSISINVISGDDIINKSESEQPITKITGSLSSEDVKNGGTLNSITVEVNGVKYEVPSQNIIQTSNGEFTYSVDVKTSDLVSDNNVIATSNITDKAGNSADIGTNRHYDVDIVAPKIEVIINEDANDDGRLSNTENLDQNNVQKDSVTAKIKLTNLEAGDIIRIKGSNDTVYRVSDDANSIVDDNGKEIAEISNGSAQFNIGGIAIKDGKANIEATVTDGANENTGKDSVEVSSINVEFSDDKGNDGYLTGSDKKLMSDTSKTTTTTTVSTIGLKNGDIITISYKTTDGSLSESKPYNVAIDNNGNITITNREGHIVTSGKVGSKELIIKDQIEIIEGKTYQVNSDITNGGKVIATSNDQVTNIAPKTPVVEFNQDKNGDGILSKDESRVLSDENKDNHVTTAKITIPEEAVTGDKITVTLNDPVNGKTTATYTYNKDSGELTKDRVEGDGKGTDYDFPNVLKVDGNSTVLSNIPIANDVKNTIDITYTDGFGNKTTAQANLTPNIISITNSGLDVDVYYYSYTGKKADGTAYGSLSEGKGGNLAKAEKWIQDHDASATFNALKIDANATQYTNIDHIQGGGFEQFSKSLGGGVTNLNAVAKFAGVNFGDQNTKGADFTLKPVSNNGNYTLKEAAPMGSDVIFKYNGYIYIEKDGSYDFRGTVAGHQSSRNFSIKIDGNEILNKDGNSNTHIIQTNSATDLTQGFHKVEILFTESSSSIKFAVDIKEVGDADYKNIGDNGSNAHFFSNSYVDALAQNNIISTNDNGTTYTSNYETKSDGSSVLMYTEKNYNDVVEYSATADSLKGSNIDDVFVYNKDQDIDAKGGTDTLVVSDKDGLVDFTTVSGLDKKLDSFEIIKLGTKESESVSIKLDADSIASIIDSQNTKDIDYSAKNIDDRDKASSSLDTILRIDGDSNDVLSLKGFKQLDANDADVALQNSKHSVTGGINNQIDTSNYTLYKGETSNHETVYVQVKNEVHVDL